MGISSSLYFSYLFTVMSKLQIILENWTNCCVIKYKNEETKGKKRLNITKSMTIAYISFLDPSTQIRLYKQKAFFNIFYLQLKCMLYSVNSLLLLIIILQMIFRKKADAKCRTKV